MVPVMDRGWWVGVMVVVVAACGRVHEPKGQPGGHTERPDAAVPADGPVEADSAVPAGEASCGVPHEDAGADAGCAPACTVGSRRCGPRGNLQVCAPDESMCPAWVNDSSCGAGKRCNTRPAAQEQAVARQHRLDRGLLQHDFTKPDFVRVGYLARISAPRQIPPFAVVPAK